MTATVPHQRCLDPIAPVHPAVVHPAVVANEVAIHVQIGPRPQADHRLVPSIDGDVAALGTAGTDTRGLVEIPGAGLMEKVLGDERSNRAEIHYVARPGMVESLVR